MHWQAEQSDGKEGRDLTTGREKRRIIKSTILFDGCPSRLCHLSDVVHSPTNAKVEDWIAAEGIGIG